MIFRLQRDLSDSTVLRNIGLAFGHTFLSLNSMIKGLKKLSSDSDFMLNELNSHPQLLAEAYQSFFRSKGVPGAYEILKERTRGKTVALEDLYGTLEEVSVLTEEDKVALKNLTVQDYLGYAQELAESVLDK